MPSRTMEKGVAVSDVYSWEMQGLPLLNRSSSDARMALGRPSSPSFQTAAATCPRAGSLYLKIGFAANRVGKPSSFERISADATCRRISSKRSAASASSRFFPVDDFALAGSPPDSSSAWLKLATETTLPLPRGAGREEGVLQFPGCRWISAALAGRSRDRSRGTAGIIDPAPTATTTANFNLVAAIGRILFYFRRSAR